MAQQLRLRVLVRVWAYSEKNLQNYTMVWVESGNNGYDKDFPSIMVDWRACLSSANDISLHVAQWPFTTADFFFSF